MKKTVLFLSILFLFGCIGMQGQAPYPLTGEITEFKDIEYANLSMKNRLDIYVPQEGSGPFPAIIWIHGGGWISGSKEDCQGKELSRYGYAVACVGYRLSTEAKFPAQIHDIKAAIRWLRANSDRYNIDPERIGVFGPSAGGHLAALAGSGGNAPGLEGNVGVSGYSSMVQAVADWYGPTDFLAPEVIGLGGKVDMNNSDPEYYNMNEKYAASFLIGTPVENSTEKARAANPITYVDQDDPPFLLMHGTSDTTVPYNQSILLYQALNGSGIEVEFIPVIGGGHGGWGMFDEEGVAGEQMRATIDFFERNLK